MSSLTHFDSQGQAHMVDVADKPATRRAAVASGRIEMLPATLAQAAHVACTATAETVGRRGWKWKP